MHISHAIEPDGKVANVSLKKWNKFILFESKPISQIKSEANNRF